MDMFSHVLVHLQYTDLEHSSPQNIDLAMQLSCTLNFLCKQTNLLQPRLMVGLFIIGFICVYVGICSSINLGVNYSHKSFKHDLLST
jgi:hypothetical protein